MGVFPSRLPRVSRTASRTFASAQAAYIRPEAIERGAVLLRDGRQCAVLEVFGANFGLLAADAQEATLAGFAAFLDGLDFAIQIVVRVLPADVDRRAAAFERAAASGLPAPLADLAVDHGLFLRRLGRERALLERRCYVVVPADAPPAQGRRQRPWHQFGGARAEHRRAPGEVERQLAGRCDAVARGLARCDLQSRRLDTAALTTLYDGYWNPDQSPSAGAPQPLTDYTTPVVTRSAERIKDAARSLLDCPGDMRVQDDGAAAGEARFALGLRTLADLIAPSAVEHRPAYLRLERAYVRTLKLADYPRTVTPGWLEPLFALGEPIDLSLHIHPLDAGSVVRALSRKLAQFQSSRLLEARDGRLADPQREVAFEDAERLREALQRGEERVFSTGVYLTLHGRSPQTLDESERRVAAALAGMRARARVALFEQDRAFRACLPLAHDELLACRNLDTSSLATLYPFSSAAPSTDGGVLCGVTTHSHAPVFLDAFDPALENANHVVFAKSGAGKSFATKLLALRQLLRGVDVLVVDPEDEYRRLCDAVGGAYIRLSSASGHRLNPFDLPPSPVPFAPPRTDTAGKAARGAIADERDQRDALAEQVTALLTLCELMLAEPGARLGTHERAVLDRALYDAYGHAGITADPASHGRPVPVMKDLLESLTALPDPSAPGLAQRLRRYVDGSLAGLFTGPTNVALDRAFTVFNIQALEAELRAVAIHLITTFVWGQVRRVQTPRLLIVDEAWSLLQHEEGGAFLASLARRARKYHLGLVCITQDVADFLGCEHGRTVLANAAVKLLLKQDGSAIGPVADVLQLSRQERQFLLGAAKGEGLLCARGARVPLLVQASDREYQLATTAPQDVRGRAAAAGDARREQPADDAARARSSTELAATTVRSEV